MIVDAKSRSVILKTHNPLFIKEVIPKSKLVATNDGHNIAVKFGVEEVQVLRNMNIKVPSPIRYYYPWAGPLTPFSHQIDTSDFLTMHKRAFVLSEMGTGKSLSILWAADYLMEQGILNKVIVVAPLSTLERVWKDEINAHFMHRKFQILHGTREQRIERLAKDADFYIINHDGLEIIKTQLAARKDISLIVVDEASVYRNAGTKKYKQLKAAIQPHHWIWMMTGTPCPNAPTDAWALARIINPSNVPQFFGTFKRETMYQVTQYKWVPKPNSYALAHKALSPAIRFRKDDCLDLPPVLFEDRRCELTPTQKSAFKDMKANLMADIISAGGMSQVPAVNAADMINKLRQILCGVVKVPGQDDYVELDYGPRLSVLLECIEQSSSKTIVVVPFKGITRSLYEHISKHHSCAVLNGDVPINKRNDIIKKFKEEADPKVLLCHPKVMAHGLNLTEASTLAFFAPIYSNDEYQQVKDRINRPGQSHKMTIVRIAGHSLEEGIYHRLDTKALTQEGILELFKEVMA